MLLVTVLLQASLHVGIAVYFHFNKTYITSKLCENRSNPELKCNGRCYLTKQLKKAEEGERKHTQNIIKEKEEVIAIAKKAVIGSYLPVFTVTLLKAAESNLYSCSHRDYPVKPPCGLV